MFSRSIKRRVSVYFIGPMGMIYDQEIEKWSIYLILNLKTECLALELGVGGLLNKQARKSSEDTHFTEYARFEKVWAG